MAEGLIEEWGFVWMQHFFGVPLCRLSISRMENRHEIVPTIRKMLKKHLIEL